MTLFDRRAGPWIGRMGTLMVDSTPRCGFPEADCWLIVIGSGALQRLSYSD